MAIVINGSGTVTGISVGGLPDAIVDAGTLAVNSRGTVLQVVEGSSDSDVTTTSTGVWTDSGLTASITPSATSSKILVIQHQFYIGRFNTGGEEWEGSFRILRDSTTLYATVTNAFSAIAAVQSSKARVQMGNTIAHSYLDSPSTTSAITYKTQGYMQTGDVLVVNRASARSTLTLMEIAG